MITQWLSDLSFGQVICLIGCLAVSVAIVIGAIRGHGE